MIRVFIGGAAIAALAACQPTVPDSAAGVGFDNYDRLSSERAARDAELTGRTTITGPAPVLSSPLDGSDPATSADAQAAADARAANSGEDPLQASAANPPPTVNNEFGISTEQNFDAVSSERSIEGDARRIAQSRAQYTVVQPTALPSRGGEGPNIVQYALRTTHPVGTQLYSRGRTSDTRFQRACAPYASSDQAQIVFLANGGPERDRAGMDPDGDGYACYWNPAPYRAAKSPVAGR